MSSKKKKSHKMSQKKKDHISKHFPKVQIKLAYYISLGIE